MSAARELGQAILRGDRRALSKGITLVESSRPADRAAALELLTAIGSDRQYTFRVGVTGVPGAGKSSLIDVLGRHAIRHGHRVAVLAVDPSSRRSGGSVLGDKTRMSALASEESAFVRPSPTLGVLGGTAGRTREAIALCEAGGYDWVLVETVGVGQSEEHVAAMVDCVLLVLLAGAGDELSSMKRGVLEAADVIVYNKADGDRVSLVENEAAALRSSLGISRADRLPPVLAISALQSRGLEPLWSELVEYQGASLANGSFAARRSRQRQLWFESALDETWRELWVRRAELATARLAAEQRVLSGAASPVEAAQRLVSELLPEVTNEQSHPK